MKKNLSKIDQIRVILGLHKFESAQLTDGTNVEAESFVEGANLMIVDVDGNKTPAKAGSYETADMTITVDDSGVITSVVAKPKDEVVTEPIPVAAAEVVPTEEVPAEEAPAEETVEEMVNKLVDAKMAEVYATVEALASELALCKTKLTDMGASFAAFKKAPAAEPLKKAEFVKTTFSDIEEKVQNLRNIRAEFNKDKK